MYNFDFAMSATISPEVLKEMITSIVQAQTGRKVTEIEFVFKGVSDITLSHVEVKFDAKQASTPQVNYRDKVFIAQHDSNKNIALCADAKKS